MTDTRAEAAHLVSWPAIWGLLGVTIILGNPIIRLGMKAWELTQRPLQTHELVVLVVTIIFFAWTEGWKGFHLKFSPRVVVRASRLHEAPRWVQVLAPFACMGLIWATRKRLIVSWVLVGVISLLVLATRQVGWPWRHIIDAGVVVGLSAGTLSIYWHYLRALQSHMPMVPADVP